MHSFIQPGAILDLDPGTTVRTGTGHLFGTVFGVAVVDAVAGVASSFGVEGVLDIAKTSALAIAVGDALFWDATNSVVNKTSTGQLCVGIAVAAAPNPSPTVRMFIRGEQPVPAGALLDAVQSFTKAQAVAPVALTPGATVTPDSSASNNFSLAAAQNFTLANATNPAASRALNIEISQDATGSRVITYGSEYLFAAAADKVLSTAAASVDYLSCVRNAANTFWLCSLAKAFA